MENNIKTRAVIYTRFSTQNQHQSSTDTQKAMCAQYCVEHNYEIIKFYSDEAMSGTNTNREKYLELLEDARKKIFDVVVIYEMSRSNRDVVEWFTFRKFLKENNIRIESTGEKLGDLLNPSDFLNEGVKAIVSQHQAIEARKKSMDTKIILAKTGVFLGGIPPLGYDIVKQKYIINEREAEVIREIFNLYDSGLNKTQIANEIQKYNVLGKRGAKLGISSIYEILTNERYIGTYSWMKFKNREMHKWVGHMETDYGTTIENAIPSIVDKELFERVQEKLKNRKNGSREYLPNKYQLSGILECGHCGAKLQGRKNTSNGYTTVSYVCPNKYKTKTCNQPNLPAKDVEATVSFKLHEWLSHVDIQKLSLQIAKTQTKIKPDASLRMQLKKVEASIHNFMDVIKAGGYSLSMKPELDSLEEKKQELEYKIKENEFEVYNQASILEDAFEKIKNDQKNINPENMKPLISNYVSKIIAKDNEIEIQFGVRKNHMKKGTNLSYLCDGSPSAVLLLDTICVKFIKIRNKIKFIL